MKAINLMDLLRRRKFKVFDIHLDNGKIIPVKHPDCVLFNQSMTVAVVAQGEHLHIVNIDHISTLSQTP